MAGATVQWTVLVPPASSRCATQTMIAWMDSTARTSTSVLVGLHPLQLRQLRSLASLRWVPPAHGLRSHHTAPCQMLQIASSMPACFHGQSQASAELPRSEVWA